MRYTKVYKEKQFLVFDFENGKTVKYDFATKQTIGIRGKPVNSLSSQLRGLSIDQIIEACKDKQYGKFLNFVRNQYRYDIYNVGTLLSKIPLYSRYEQIFSSGIDGIIEYRSFSKTINEIPKSLIKSAQVHSIRISDNIVECWKANVDAYNLAYTLDYISLNDSDIWQILDKSDRVYDRVTHTYHYVSYIGTLINDYGYTAKALFLYIDRLKTFEAIEDMSYILRELLDYAKMMSFISPKYDKHPRNFLTTHKIATRNYNRLKQEFSEEKFKEQIRLDYEGRFGEYCFIYPKCTQDIKDEAVMQNNCVASYIDRVIDGQCHILFLRKLDNLEKSLVTIEVRDDKIVQAYRHFNDPITIEDQWIIDKWNKKHSNDVAEAA